MTAPAPARLAEPLPSAAAQAATDVITLLRRGRVTVALAQLEKLPGLIRDEVTDRTAAVGLRAYRDGYHQGRQDLAAEITGTATAPKRQPAPKRTAP